MKMIYEFITNNVELAQYAVSCGVNRIFIDTEYLGKKERQKNLKTHKASHSIGDVKKIKQALPETELLVRINPVNKNTPHEIEKVIKAGSDVIMLPMFATCFEVKRVINLIKKRNKLCLLLETPQALVRLDKILEMSDEIDEIHVGLNDLRIGMGLSFLFELLSGGIVEYIAKKVKKKKIRFGFGGIACIGEGDIPAELILGEHVRLGSEMVILSQAFHQNALSVEKLKEKINLKKEIEKLNKCLDDFQKGGPNLLEKNRIKFKERVDSFVEKKYKK